MSHKLCFGQDPYQDIFYNVCSVFPVQNLTLQDLILFICGWIVVYGSRQIYTRQYSETFDSMVKGQRFDDIPYTCFRFAFIINTTLNAAEVTLKSLTATCMEVALGDSGETLAPLRVMLKMNANLDCMSNIYNLIMMIHHTNCCDLLLFSTWPSKSMKS